MKHTRVIEPTEFRRVLGVYPTGVCVVSGQVDGNAIGITVGSFTSISLDPPLVGFFIDRASMRWPLIASTGTFCISVLSAEQSNACFHFTKHRDDEFAGFTDHPEGLDLPVIADAIAWITCEIASTHQLGDHDLIVGKVTSLTRAKDGTPLVFCRGALGQIAPIAA